VIFPAYFLTEAFSTNHATKVQEQQKNNSSKKAANIGTWKWTEAYPTVACACKRWLFREVSLSIMKFFKLSLCKSTKEHRFHRTSFCWGLAKLYIFFKIWQSAKKTITMSLIISFTSITFMHKRCYLHE